jgi:gamma-glutamyltranspeptidase
MKHPELAATFEAVAEQGPKGFYTGRIAEGKCFTAVS